ncbi:MAG TPA: hypothetical protein VJG32_21075 [Anaerolineae bacterium]|nr:hypothetical protein [Anaerolineae bacterium]
MSKRNPILIAIGIVVAVMLLSAVIGALLNLVQCLFFAALVAVGAVMGLRWLRRRSLPVSKHIVDQRPSATLPRADADPITGQLQARRKRLGRRE